MRIGRLLALLVTCVLAANSAQAADVHLSIDASQPGHTISPRLVGIFLEDINFGVDGGLNAELVKNGSFEFPQALMAWSTESRGALQTGNVVVRNDAPAYPANPHYLRISPSEAGAIVINEGFRGMGVRTGEHYRFSMAARDVGDQPVRVQVSLVGDDDNMLAAVEISDIKSDWSECDAVLTPSDTAAKARLVIEVTGPGTVDLDMVSLYPEKTWRHRPHGLRADIVQALADLKPAFFRFPGGCIVEGGQLTDRYQWKQTIGDRANRKLNFNRWNTVFQHRPAPDYFQSYGVGFYEYFLLAEDIGASPLPILNCGMACQFQSAELVPLDELQPYLQDMFDLIEFANGSTTSAWGARRAALGHPEPFHLKMLGVGNEQWGPEYFERYQIFARALKEKHPEIELVSGTGPFPSDEKFRYAWQRLRKLGAEIVDEHCYASPDWFLRSATRFDGYPRSGPRVFMGEYAAQSVDITSPDNRNNLRCALAEAAFLTGIERNSDVVVMSAYAPLLGHVDAWQWRPNLIWFDNLNTFVTPNYYVQQLFGRNLGDVVLPVTITDARPADPPYGRIGLSTDQASAEFKDIRVERDGQRLFSSDELTDSEEMTTFRGRWVVEGDVVGQTRPGDVARAEFGDQSWRDYTLSMKVRKLSGAGGIGVIFRNSEGGSFLEWMLGSRDKQHQLVANLASHIEDISIVSQLPGEIANERWYDVKVVLNGEQVRCFLDGELVHDATIPGPEVARLFVAASRDNDSNELILKVVNPTDLATEVAISLNGVEPAASPAEVFVLAGEPEAENSLDHPDRVIPRSDTLEVTGKSFDHTYPPNSLSIIRIKTE